MEESQYQIDDADLPNQTFKQNEFECLNLNITCPAVPTTQGQLPVMVWIHGSVLLPYRITLSAYIRLNRGGDQGSGSNWVYDGGALVKKSILMGSPIIMVTFKYAPLFH
jgi:carboxylesterase type B